MYRSDFHRRAAMSGRHGHRHGHGGPGWGDFGGGRGWGGGRRRRMRRGDVRAALLVLLEEQPQTGYGLMEEIERRSEGAWVPSPGSVYPTLKQLEDEELVRAEAGEGRTPFTLTDAGKAYVEENREKLGGALGQARPGRRRGPARAARPARADRGRDLPGGRRRRRGTGRQGQGAARRDAARPLPDPGRRRPGRPAEGLRSGAPEIGVVEQRRQRLQRARWPTLVDLLALVPRGPHGPVPGQRPGDLGDATGERRASPPAPRPGATGRTRRGRHRGRAKRGSSSPRRGRVARSPAARAWRRTDGRRRCRPSRRTARRRRRRRGCSTDAGRCGRGSLARGEAASRSHHDATVRPWPPPAGGSSIAVRSSRSRPGGASAWSNRSAIAGRPHVGHPDGQEPSTCGARSSCIRP